MGSFSPLCSPPPLPPPSSLSSRLSFPLPFPSPFPSFLLWSQNLDAAGEPTRRIINYRCARQSPAGGDAATRSILGDSFPARPRTSIHRDLRRASTPSVLSCDPHPRLDGAIRHRHMLLMTRSQIRLVAVDQLAGGPSWLDRLRGCRRSPVPLFQRHVCTVASFCSRRRPAWLPRWSSAQGRPASLDCSPPAGCRDKLSRPDARCSTIIMRALHGTFARQARTAADDRATNGIPSRR